jgi:hypothetical protein
MVAVSPRNVVPQAFFPHLDALHIVRIVVDGREVYPGISVDIRRVWSNNIHFANVVFAWVFVLVVGITLMPVADVLESPSKV